MQIALFAFLQQRLWTSYLKDCLPCLPNQQLPYSLPFDLHLLLVLRLIERFVAFLYLNDKRLFALHQIHTLLFLDYLSSFLKPYSLRCSFQGLKCFQLLLIERLLSFLGLLLTLLQFLFDFLFDQSWQFRHQLPLIPFL